MRKLNVRKYMRNINDMRYRVVCPKIIYREYFRHEILAIYDIKLLYFCSFVSPPRGAGQQIQSRLVEYPPPRKSLVKGERFIRSEGRPEWNELGEEGWQLISHREGLSTCG